MKHRQAQLRIAAVAAMTALLASACGTGGPASVDDLATSGAAREGDALAQIRDSGVLRVANTQANPPYSLIDDSNELVGFDVDVANEMATRMGIDRVEFIVGTFQTFIPGLQSDKWDAVIAGLTITEERQQQVDFSCPYQVNDVAIFTADGAEGIQDEADLVGRSIAVTAGGTQEEQARGIEGATVLTYENATLALSDVATGRADAYIGSKFTGAYLAEQNGLDVIPAEGYLSREINGMAFPKGQEELVAAANEALAEMIDDGTLSDISRQWLGGLDIVEGLAELPQC
ncbi:MAG: transporter substrate-binding domain-containing protein [Geodermatophilaceae bacterium]|nr:transporter substrate-binding domain-containing protein [Geodermatophilaceae bacterium]